MKICRNKGDEIEGYEIRYQSTKPPKISKKKVHIGAHTLFKGKLKDNVVCIIEKRLKRARISY